MSSSEALPTTSRLEVIAPHARIHVLDALLRPVPEGVGNESLTVDLPPGAYRVTARVGARQVSESVLVRAGDAARNVTLHPEFDAAAPVEGSATSNETHGMLSAMLSHAPPGPATRSRLVVVLRGLRRRPMAPLSAADPSIAPEVRDQDGRLLTLPAPFEDPHHQARPERPNRALGWAIDVQPGGCRVRWNGADGRQDVEHALWVPEGCQALLFVPQGPSGPLPAGASVHVLPLTQGWTAYDHRTVEVETTLARLRSASLRQRSEIWERTLNDPSAPLMLTLLTCVEVLRANTAEELPRPLVPPLTRAVLALRAGFGQAPDVVALDAALGGLPPREQVSWPPMLRASHQLLLRVEHDTRYDPIAPMSLAELVTGQTYASAPWHLYDPEGLDDIPVTGRAASPAGASPVQPPPSDAPPAPPPTRGGAGTHRLESSDAGVGHPAHAGAPMPGGGGDDSPGAPHPSPVAVERVESLLHTMESHLTDGTKVSPTEVAERLGMTTALAQSCIDVLDPGG